MNPKDEITNLIKQSTDDGIQGNAFKEESYLQEIRFSDVIAIILYYISLQPDLDKIGQMNTNDFWCLFKKEWYDWTKINRQFCSLNSAWSSEPGPGGGGAGLAEIYFCYHPGIGRCDRLSHFFQYPSRFNYGWGVYRDKRIKIYIFPKWRRNIKKLDAAFDLAESICEEMRNQTAR